MKKLILIPFLFISLIISATNYHFATAGNDVTGDGSIATPYQTITKVNSLWAVGTFAPGDSICFKRGDTFTGTLTITESGTLANRIIVGAYGTGDDPIITGFTALSTWTSEGGSIYSKTVTLASSTYNIVSVDGVNSRIGRFPNAGVAWPEIDSHDGSIALTDAHLDKAVTDWTGAEVVVRVNDFTIERRTISDHTRHTLTFTTLSDNMEDGWGYFIQNDLKTLDAANEWYYSGTKFYIYGDPAAKTVKVSNSLNAVVINSFDYILFDNINFTGYGGDCFLLTDATGITIQNCTLSFVGETAIRGNDETSGVSHDCLIDNNIITEVNSNGIFVASQFEDITITNNTISDIGMISGAAHNTGYAEYSYMGINLQMASTNTLSLVEYNSVSDIGYIGIGFWGTHVIVRHNFVNNFCLIKQDGAGIYTYNTSPSDVTTVGSILNNIVMNGIGNLDGVIATNLYYWAFGIYVDGYSRGITVNDNSVTKCTRNFFCNGFRDGIVRRNTFFNATNGYAFYMSKFNNVIDMHANLLIKGNIMVAKAATEKAFAYVSSYGELSATASTDSNYYARPIDDDNVFRYYSKIQGNNDWTLAQWVTFRGDDANSDVSPASVADTANIHFVYNNTKVTKTFNLSAAMVDVANTSYDNDIYVLPYSSLVLIGAGTITEGSEVPPNYPSIVITLDSYNIIKAGISGECNGSGGGVVTEYGLCWNTTGSPTTTDNKIAMGSGLGTFSTFINSLHSNTTYYIRGYANNGLVVYSNQVSFTTPVYSNAFSGGKAVYSGGKVVIIK